jgi:hypothetical protein
MSQTTTRTDVDEDLAESLVSASRTSLGDNLRSVIYFTPSAFDVLYVRRDLYDSTEDARDVKSPLVDIETVGFGEAPIRSAISREEAPSSIGSYTFTVRFHDEGFVVRVLDGDVGVLLTTDSMDVRAFEEGVSAVKKLLSGR